MLRVFDNKTKINTHSVVAGLRYIHVVGHDYFAAISACGLGRGIRMPWSPCRLDEKMGPRSTELNMWVWCTCEVSGACNVSAIACR